MLLRGAPLALEEPLLPPLCDPSSSCLADAPSEKGPGACCGRERGPASSGAGLLHPRDAESSPKLHTLAQE